MRLVMRIGLAVLFLIIGCDTNSAENGRSSARNNLSDSSTFSLTKDEVGSDGGKEDNFDGFCCISKDGQVVASMPGNVEDCRAIKPKPGENIGFSSSRCQPIIKEFRPRDVIGPDPEQTCCLYCDNVLEAYSVSSECTKEWRNRPIPINESTGLPKSCFVLYLAGSYSCDEKHGFGSGAIPVLTTVTGNLPALGNCSRYRVGDTITYQNQNCEIKAVNENEASCGLTLNCQSLK